MATKKSIGFLFALLLVLILVLGLGLVNPAVCAEQVFDVNPCVACEQKPLVLSPEINIFAMDCKGIMISKMENKIFDNVTVHAQGVMVVEGNKMTMYAHMKYLDQDGDFIVVRYSQNPGETSATTTFISGTGKWKGINGGGKATPITKGKPIVPGTTQFCNNHKGKFTVP